MGIVRTAKVTNRETGAGSNMPGPNPSCPAAVTPTTSADSIVSGLARMSAAEWNDRRDDRSPSCVRPWITASVLARIGEVPSKYITSITAKKIEESLDYLQRLHIPGSGWSENGAERADALTTSWTIIALRSHRRPVPHEAIDFLLRCRQSDGGFSPHPATDSAWSPRNPEITVTALRALNTCDRAAGDFVASSLRDDLSVKLAGKSSRFYMCSEILDWEPGRAPWPVLHLVSQSAVQFDMEGPYEQALLLRILLRMRNQRAWLAADALRKMQLPDGSWPAVALTAPSAQPESKPLSAIEKALLTSATAISALALNQGQPAGYSTNDATQTGKWGAE